MPYRDGVASKRHKDRFPWDAPRSSAGHQNGGQRLAQPHFPRYFDHDEIIILSCRSRSDMPGFYDYLLNEIHVEDAPPLFLKYFPTEGVLVMLGAVIVLLDAGLGAIWEIPPPDGGSPSGCPKFSPTSCTIA
ncbi:hypothetical protein [Bilophila wadsworthia]